MYYTFAHTDISAKITIMCTALAVTIILAVTVTVTVVITLKRFIYRKDDTALHARVTDNTLQIEGGNTHFHLPSQTKTGFKHIGNTLLHPICNKYCDLVG